ncbi:hypothetical protein [Chryseobacterium sp.]|uniref:hypothetical protein n=1 Tax=Chryseobacterium sp. TaxID=1871047 RepID=UPI0025B8B9FC|nr:hypothetical protein [Chryseobacterium sp.]
MNKSIFFKVFLGLGFGILFSCDNTTADPLNQNKSNNGGSGNNGGTTITGPRILEKIVVNNIIQEEYVTDAGFLEKGSFKDESAPNTYFTGNVTYVNNKISRVKFVSTASGSLTYDFNITYDSNGRISGTTAINSLGTVTVGSNDYVYTYDSAGKISKILEKRKMPGTSNYIGFVENALTYSGDNISKVVWTMGTMDSNGIPDMSSGTSTTYNYQSYDSKINPYTTLPKTFFIMWSLIHPANFYTLSANNVGAFNFVFPSPAPSVTAPKTYLYDSQNYPVSDQTQAIKYVYKAL